MSLLNNPLYHAFVARYAHDPLGFVLGVCGNAVSPDQERLLNAIVDPTAKVSVVSGTGCFGIDTPVMRADGTIKLIQNVQIGDVLMGDDNTPRTVLELKRGQEQMYRFTLQNGAEYVFNENHTLCLVATINKRGFKRGDKFTMSVREYLILPEWWRKRLFFYKAECEQFFRQPANILLILHRKTHTPSSHINHTWFAVERVESLGMGDYYGFVLDGNGQFLGADGFVLHNTGKTMCFGRIALWHLLCFPVARYDGKTEIGSNTYIGAPAIKQVGDGVWKEITDAVQQMAANPATAWLAEYIIVQAERVYIKGYKAQWFITKFAMQQGQSVAIAGKHRFYQLIIVDEAAGVSDEHYEVINGTQTQGGNRTLLASQGVKQAGFFYDTHHKLNKANGGNWTALCFSSENSPFVEQSWIDNVALQAGGRETTEYRVRVLGKFAENEYENLLTRAAIEQCFVDYKRADGTTNPQLIEQGEPYGWLLLVDVGAGEYRDDSVCIVAKIIGDDDFGSYARRVEYQPNPIVTNTKNIREFRGLILQKYAELSSARVVLDVGGIGLELAKMLEEDGVDVYRVNWGAPCFKRQYKERFFNQRACAMVRWRDATRQRRVSYPVMENQLREKFLNQASRIPYGFTDTGTARYQIAKKEDMRKKGIKSPDLADAMSFAFLDGVYYNVSEAAFDISGSLKNDDDLIAAALKELNFSD